jgi:hypothetical protein
MSCRAWHHAKRGPGPCRHIKRLMVCVTRTILAEGPLQLLQVDDSP